MTSVEADLGPEEDPKCSVFRDLYVKTEARLASLFDEISKDLPRTSICRRSSNHEAGVQDLASQGEVIAKKPARTIDEDNYDDSDGEEEEGSCTNESPLKNKGGYPSATLSSKLGGLSSSSISASAKVAPNIEGSKTVQEAREQLEMDKKSTEDAAKRTFHTLFYTYENDKDAMLEQKRLEESERQVEVELGNGSAGVNANGGLRNAAHTGTLSQTNLGASSLTLKNLIKRIDDHRDKVPASDTDLKQLISEVRKNRSKWANEDKVGQEELYEAAEKVLNELKAMTEHSGPFLTKVNKRDAPDYGIRMRNPPSLSVLY